LPKYRRFLAKYSRLWAKYWRTFAKYCGTWPKCRGFSPSTRDFELDEVKDYGQEIERTGYLISDLSLEYEVSVSRVFASASSWRHRDSPFLSKVREQARA